MAYSPQDALNYYSSQGIDLNDTKYTVYHDTSAGGTYVYDNSTKQSYATPAQFEDLNFLSNDRHVYDVNNDLPFKTAQTQNLDSKYLTKIGNDQFPTSQQSWNATLAANGGVAPGNPAPVSNPIDAGNVSSGNTAAPTLPTPQAGNVANNYNQSLNTQIQQQQAAIQSEADKRAADYQTQIDALNKEKADYQAKMDAGLGGLDEATKKTLAGKEAALTLEKQRFDENYNANQALIGELGTLLTQGNALVEEMQNTTGLASIMNPRIAKTMSDVQARAGVIQAVLAARNGQMSYAQQQLGTTYDALSSMLTDQSNYYKTVIDFYGNLKNSTTDSIFKLSVQQQGYLDNKLDMLNKDLANLQQTKQHLSEVMMDPDTASMYANAGVTMNDSIEQIGKKLADYSYSQELKDYSNKAADSGYTSTPIAGVTPVYITDSRGNVKAWYKKPAEATTGASTSYKDVNGRQLLINDVTGETIKDIGPTASSTKLTEVSPGATLYDPVTNKAVYTAPTSAVTTAAAEKKQDDLINAFPTTTLAPGASGSEVTKLQNALVGLGYMSAGQVNGQYDSTTTAAVLELQKKLGIDYSSGPGYFGPRTQAGLKANLSTAKKTSSGSTSNTAGVTALKQALQESKYKGAEADGKYADPNLYLANYNSYPDKAEFLRLFPPSQYINPENTWLPPEILKYVGESRSL